MPNSVSPESRRGSSPRGAGVTAVLGPTNTGKTHLAIERMLGHSSGIIGLPLRLLAREVYNKIAERVGVDAVALVTGEEKVKPANPRYWVSTVEAMPRDLDVAFLAVDEVQLAADLERGHVFTDRMLHYRGREETLVLGAQTVRPLVERLLPGAHVITRPRLSQLSFAGEKKITRLPRRSAIVAFSAEEVYSIAEFIRRQRGGAAVVLGALSPRTRNAQVELYQSGDVEYLVATDAIGMGLNLDVDHVAFASDRKFDGYQFRRLNPAELAQIAGRAGRATRNGTFGTTGRCPAFETALAQALEAHAFEAIKVLQWRNTALDFSSLGALQASLAQIPTENGLTRAPIAEDILVLEHAVRDDEIRSLAKTSRMIERLWDVCQIPDYRKISPAAHAELVTTLYGFLIKEGNIPTDWFARQAEQADRTDGDIDTLSNRIAHIRTWTFAANRPDWLADPEHWQAVTRAVEDKLSDALHQRLTERFVDRRTSVLIRRLRDNSVLEASVSKTGEVVVEGHAIGRLDGFMFTPVASTPGSEAKALAGAAQKSLAGEINARATRLAQAADGQLTLANDYTIRWLGQPVAMLVAGEEPLKPRLRIICDEHLSGAPRDAVQARVDFWLKSHIERVLEPLFRLAAADDVTGMARGIAYQLIEGLGVLERQKVAEEIKGLDQASRATLRKYGVRFGAYHIFLPVLLKPGARVLATQLWALKHENGPETKGAEAVLELAGSGRTSIAADKDCARVLFRVAGYRICGARAVRVDILERLADLIRSALAWRAGAAGAKPPGAVDGFGFAVTVSMTSLAGCAGEDFASILQSLGYQMEKRPRPPAPVAEPASDLSAEAAGTAELPSSEQIAIRLDASASGGEEIRADPPSALNDLPNVGAEISEPGPSGTESATLAPAAPEPSQAPVAENVNGADETAPSQSAGIATTQDGALELIEVWRPVRRGGQRNARREHSSRRRQRAERPEMPSRPVPANHELGVDDSAIATEPATAAATATEVALSPENDGVASAHARRKGHRRRDHAPAEAPEGTAQRRSPRRARRAPKETTEPIDRGTPSVVAERPRREPRGDRPDRDPALRAKYIKGKGAWGASREPDPDSPFAKLAKLKEQLEANAKSSR